MISREAFREKTAVSIHPFHGCTQEESPVNDMDKRNWKAAMGSFRCRRRAFSSVSLAAPIQSVGSCFSEEYESKIPQDFLTDGLRVAHGQKCAPGIS